MSLAWDTFESTIAPIIASATGLSVVWEGANALRPALPYVSLWHDSEECLSPVSEDLVSDNSAGHAGDPSSTPPVIGTEILVTHKTPSEFHLRVQVFSATSRGTGSAGAIMSAIHNLFDLYAVHDALEAIDIVTVDRGTIQRFCTLVESKLEDRAVLDIRFRFTDGISETSTYIETLASSEEIDR